MGIRYIQAQGVPVQRADISKREVLRSNATPILKRCEVSSLAIRQSRHHRRVDRYLNVSLDHGELPTSLW